LEGFRINNRLTRAFKFFVNKEKTDFTSVRVTYGLGNSFDLEVII
jgi:hypothetical protein